MDYSKEIKELDETILKTLNTYKKPIKIDNENIAKGIAQANNKI